MNPAIVHALNNFFVRKRYWEKDSDSPYADTYRKYRNLTPWMDLPLIEGNRSFKQRLIKSFWHWLPRSLAFWLASFVRNRIRPLLICKRDDE